jgi:hypothetical protein
MKQIRSVAAAPLQDLAVHLRHDLSASFPGLGILVVIAVVAVLLGVNREEQHAAVEYFIEQDPVVLAML